MSKHSDLSAAAAKAREKFDRNRETCLMIIDRLPEALAAFLECDPAFVTIHSPKVAPGPENACRAAEAAELGSDHAWHFQLAVALGQSPDALPRDVCVFALSVGPLRLGFELFLKGKHQKVVMGNPDEPEKAHNALFTIISDLIRLKYHEEFMLFEPQVTRRPLP